MVTTKLVKMAKFKILIQIRGTDSAIFFPIGHLGFSGGQLKGVTLYVLWEAFYNLAMFFSPPAHFLLHIIPFTNFPINSFSLPWNISFAGETPVWVNAGQRRICCSWNLIKIFLTTYNCLRAKPMEIQLFM